MYRINLYPEYQSNRRRARRRMIRTGLLTVILGIELIFLAALGISGLLVKERVGSLTHDVARLEQMEASETDSLPEVKVAREVLNLRNRRTEWAPKIAALSGLIDRRLRLNELEGRIRIKRRPARLEMTGMIREGGSMQTVFGFIEALQADQRILDDFHEIRLGNLEGGGASRFLLICEPGPDAP